MQRRVSTALAVVAGAVLVLTAAGCGTTHQNSGQAQQTGPSGKCKGPSGHYVIGMSQANVAEPYRQRMDDDIKKAASKVPQFEVQFSDAAQDNSKQVSDVENYLTKQIDLLIISPNEATPLTAVVKKAYDKGIPVLVLDRKVDGDAYTEFIGADNTDLGRQAGQYFASKILPNGGKIVELRGLSGSTPAKERTDGFAEAIQGKNIQIVASEDAQWLRDKGQAAMDAMLKAHPDVQAVYSENDPMAEGAYLAAKAVGKETSLKFTGMDGLPIPSGGMMAVQQGRLAATFVYPTGGPEAIDAAKKLLIDCQTVPKQQTLATQLVTPDNAADLYAKANQG